MNWATVMNTSFPGRLLYL